jgi:hypothetical protein
MFGALSSFSFFAFLLLSQERAIKKGKVKMGQNEETQTRGIDFKE